MNYKLIMLPNPIVVSDEKPIEWYLDDTYTIRKSFTDDENYWAVRPYYKKIIAGIEGLPTVNLSLVADEIGWVDVDKVKSDYFKGATVGWDAENIERYSYEIQQDAETYARGFAAAQSLNEKKFSEEHLYKLLKLIGSKGYYVETDGSVYANAFDGGRIVNVVKEYTESLSKQEVYNVSIIQENNSITVTKILK